MLFFVTVKRNETEFRVFFVPRNRRNSDETAVCFVFYRIPWYLYPYQDNRKVRLVTRYWFTGTNLLRGERWLKLTMQVRYLILYCVLGGDWWVYRSCGSSWNWCQAQTWPGTVIQNFSFSSVLLFDINILKFRLSLGPIQYSICRCQSSLVVSSVPGPWRLIRIRILGSVPLD